jgi:hypothetical protein
MFFISLPWSLALLGHGFYRFKENVFLEKGEAGFRVPPSGGRVDGPRLPPDGGTLNFFFLTSI